MFIPIVWTLLSAFICVSIAPPAAYAGEIALPFMPSPGSVVSLTPPHIPAHLQGIALSPVNALQFTFFIHHGDGRLDNVQKEQEYTKLIRYFLAALTVPEKDQWVNLSPYEQGRIIPPAFGQTEMGRDLLSQDYLLKQIASSLMYPESELGRTFWDKVYAAAGTDAAQIPVNTLNKVWIVPAEAVVLEKENTAYVLKARLKVMLEEDYLALKNNGAKKDLGSMYTAASRTIRDVLLPVLEQEVNTGKNFAVLRQIYSGMILASWYKKALKRSVLSQAYADKNKVKGTDGDSIVDVEDIYNAYLSAFKKGVYNYIKEERDLHTNQLIPRKYFAGGFSAPDAAMVQVFRPGDAIPSHLIDTAMTGIGHGDIDQAQVSLETVAPVLLASNALSNEGLKVLEEAITGPRPINATIMRKLMNIKAENLRHPELETRLIRWGEHPTMAHAQDLVDKVMKVFAWGEAAGPLTTEGLDALMAVFEFNPRSSFDPHHPLHPERTLMRADRKEKYHTLRISDIFSLTLTEESQQAVLKAIQETPRKGIFLVPRHILERAREGKFEINLQEEKDVICSDYWRDEYTSVTVSANAAELLEDYSSMDNVDFKDGKVRIKAGGFFRIPLNINGETKYLLTLNMSDMKKKNKARISAPGGGYWYISEKERNIYGRVIEFLSKKKKVGIPVPGGEDGEHWYTGEKKLKIYQRAHALMEEDDDRLDVREIINAHDVPAFLKMYPAGTDIQVEAQRELREELMGPLSELNLFPDSEEWLARNVAPRAGPSNKAMAFMPTDPKAAGDSAMTAKGGIDLSEPRLKTIRDPAAASAQTPSFQTLDIAVGLEPRIIHIRPLTHLPLLTNLSPAQTSAAS